MYEALAWIDLEATGLDPANDIILEIAILVSDLDLNIINGDGLRIVLKLEESQISMMSPYVLKMHTDNGLVEEALKSNVTLQEAEQAVIEHLSQYTQPKKAPLCGSTIAFDRALMLTQMKELDQFLHHRNIDVSCLKELVRMYSTHPIYVPQVEGEHRALSDIVQSIEGMRYYREILFGNTPVQSK